MTERLRKSHPGLNGLERDDPPFAAVEKVRGALRLAGVDRKAMQLGLRPGLTLADARARIPHLAVALADSEADARFLSYLALSCERFTPVVVIDRPDGLLLDITGCAHLFGGEGAFRSKVLAHFARLGLSVRGTLASVPDAARALVRFTDAEVLAPGQEQALVQRLPVAALADLLADTILALSRAGLKTVGDLAHRPRSSLAARFGALLVTQLDRLLGREAGPLTPIRPAPQVSSARTFNEPLMHADMLMDVLKVLIEEAAQALLERGQGGRVFEACFFRSDGTAQRLCVETGQPSRNAQSIARLFEERLSALADPIEAGFGFDAVRVSVPAAEPLSAVQSNLDKTADESEAIGALVDRLVARFGRDRVLRIEACDTHIPERAQRLVPAASAEGANSALQVQDRSVIGRPSAAAPPSRPLQLFERPQKIDAVAEVPDGPPRRFRWRRVLHEVVACEGPERIAPEWWRQLGDPREDETRDYYRVEDQAGYRFWIFRQGFYGQECAPGWFMHGLFF